MARGLWVYQSGERIFLLRVKLAYPTKALLRKKFTRIKLIEFLAGCPSATLFR